MKMPILEKIKDFSKSLFTSNNQQNEDYDIISVDSIQRKYEEEDYQGAARDLKTLLETYGRRKRKNHRYKGREFIYFILSNKHKDLKNTGYNHWENLNHFFKSTQNKVYPYHQKNLKKAIDFFTGEIKGLYEIKLIND
jgi:hypothetical protein